MINPLRFVRPNILALEPYSTARDDFKGGDITVWVDANENPYPNGLNRYPDPHQKQLKEQISRIKNIDANQIFVGGAGSDEAIDLTYRIFCEPGIDNVVSISPSYGVYKVAAAINNVEFREVLLRDDFSLPVERILKATDRHTKLIWICSPNNPTGNAFPVNEILALADAFEGMVVVDEAYIDFADEETLIPAIIDHPNLIVLQTFSKAWGMASLRAGMAFATPSIARLYAMVKYPYNMNGPTQALLVEKIKEMDISDDVTQIVEQRNRLAKAFAEMKHVVKVYPSDANFLLVKVTHPNELYDYLIENGVIVRNRSKLRMCEGSLRFTVGTPGENDLIINLMKQYEDVE